MSEKFGEPWDFAVEWDKDTFSVLKIDREANKVTVIATNVDGPKAKRLCACVNALAGIEYPEKWVKAHKELVEKASSYLNYKGNDDQLFGVLLGDLQNALSSCEAAEGRKG